MLIFFRPIASSSGFLNDVSRVSTGIKNGTFHWRGQRIQTCKAISTTTSMSAITQKTIAAGESYSDEQVIKKSRFIGIIRRCESWKDAQDFIASVRAEHPKSRHVCFGFLAGTNPVQERSSDDGEPTGTAGSPILGALKGEELSDTVCAVVRYSGGIKLGAGGLIRAYGGSARLAIAAAETEIIIPKSIFKVISPAAAVGSVYGTINKFEASVCEENFNDKGDLEVLVTCQTKIFDELKVALKDASRGGIIFINNDE